MSITLAAQLLRTASDPDVRAAREATADNLAMRHDVWIWLQRIGGAACLLIVIFLAAYGLGRMVYDRTHD